MPHLDERLGLVARQIRSPTHADVGSDHGHLLKALLAAGRIQRGIAIENKPQPWRNSVRTLEGYPAEVRLADGLNGLFLGEADSLSICGMGGESIERILLSRPSHLPTRIVVQPNCRVHRLREWGLANGYWLIDECCTTGRRLFEVLVFQAGVGRDPAYGAQSGWKRQASIHFGPWNIRRAEPHFKVRLQEELSYFSTLPRLSPPAERRARLIQQLL